MTKLGQDILGATLGNATTILIIPRICDAVITFQHADGTVERRELGDVAIVPVIDMPAGMTDSQEIHDESAKTA